ncbi:MAG: response regulator transcription factor [Vicinamibacterales bacterium]
MKAPRIRIACVEDHSVVRAGIVALIRQEPDMEVIASAASCEAAIADYQRHRPDIVLMDLRLPDRSGWEAIRAIRQEDPTARIIVLTMHRGDEDIYRAIEAGALAYLLKDTLPDTLLDTIRKVYNGESAITPDLGARLARRISEPVLTPRELAVLQLLGKGMRNKEIAAELQISQETVVVHLRSVFGKLHVHDRTAALTAAIQRGLIHVD